MLLQLVTFVIFVRATTLSGQQNHSHDESRVRKNWCLQDCCQDDTEDEWNTLTLSLRVAEVGNLSASAKNAFNSFVGRVFANSRQKTLFFCVLPKLQQKGSFYLVLPSFFYLVLPSFT